MIVELTEALKLQLELADGYKEIRELPGRGICAVQRFIYTSGIVSGIDEWGYEGRWCYKTMADAVAALREWNGEGDPGG